MRPLLVIFLIAAFAGCASAPSHPRANVDSVAEVVAFVPMARRAWTTDGMSEYDFHRLDLRVISPGSSRNRQLSVFIPMTEWPDERIVAAGKIIGVRLKQDDLEVLNRRSSQSIP